MEIVLIIHLHKQSLFAVSLNYKYTIIICVKGIFGNDFNQHGWEVGQKIILDDTWGWGVQLKMTDDGYGGLAML